MVKLIAVSQPVVGLNLTPEQLIAYCARVSNPKNQQSHDTAPKLLRYCIRHGHWSVFETVFMTVEIVTSRAISAQILRHRSFTFQEFSQRYSNATAFEEVNLRTQDLKNRQASGSEVDDMKLNRIVRNSVQGSYVAYEALLDAGVSRETARMVLPLCTQTTLYMTGSVRSWIHYLEQRCAPGTQTEHRQIANEIKTIFRAQFPSVAAAMEEQSQ